MSIFFPQPSQGSQGGMRNPRSLAPRCCQPDVGSQDVETHNRVVVGKSWRLHWELHLQFSDVQTLQLKRNLDAALAGHIA